MQTHTCTNSEMALVSAMEKRIFQASRENYANAAPRYLNQLRARISPLFKLCLFNRVTRALTVHRTMSPARCSPSPPFLSLVIFFHSFALLRHFFTAAIVLSGWEFNEKKLAKTRSYSALLTQAENRKHGLDGLIVASQIFFVAKTTETEIEAKTTATTRAKRIN